MCKSARVNCRKVDVRSGTVQTLALKMVPPPRRDPDAEPLQAPGEPVQEAEVPRGAKLILSDAAIAAQSAKASTRKIPSMCMP
jgi:hypothetical protein